MNNPFRVKIWLEKERGESLSKHLKDSGMIVKKTYTNSSCIVEFTIENNSDVLNIFHAGVHHGLNTGLNSLKQTHDPTV